MPTITTPALVIDYADTGPRDAPVVLLLHGWPDDRSSWDPVAASLNAAGFRTIVPSLRGFGETRFVSDAIRRTGNNAIMAIDAIALLDALDVDRFSVAGHDWGSNIAEALAIGWPDRVERIAMLATVPRLGGVPTPPFEQTQRQWYHWFMATKRGMAAVRDDPIGFAHLHWVNWSPPGWFDEATFERTAQAWRNPDWVDVTLHSYQARWDEAEPDPASVWLEARIKKTTSLSLPAVYFQGEVDGVNPPSVGRNAASKFSGPFAFVTLPGVGHFTQREAPDAVAAKLIAHFATDGASR